MKKEKDIKFYRSIYDKVFKHGKLKRNGDKWKNPYASDTGRNSTFIDYLNNIYEEKERSKIKVLDASCGRGHLLRELLNLGYQAEGTEFVPWLLENDLKDLPVRILSYQEFDVLPNMSYDVVISSDVLEHISPNKDTIIQAVKDLCRISKKHVLISVGTITAGPWPQKLNLPIKNLHEIIKGAKWWKEIFKEYIDANYTHITERKSCFFYFGTKKI
jgi:2-polyprenyl-3-methyl-5-hydroxy-6-metoxy-1,4-benzoquinol methylase